jgi:protein TonB
MPPLPPPPPAEPASKPVLEQTPVPRPIEAPDQLITQAEPIEPSAPPVVASIHRIQTASAVQSLDSAAIPAHDAIPTEPAIPSPTLDPSFQHASGTAAEAMPSVHSEPPAAIKEARPAPPPVAASGTQIAALLPAAQPKPSKVDYGWLADLMAGWIQELNKRYPAVLRTEGIEGRVTLTALLHDDGKLSDVRVAKSSGNAMLDQVAVEDVTKGPPVTLSRPLERPRMTVKFSIIYALKMAR